MVKYFGVLFFGDPLDSFCYDIACHILNRGKNRAKKLLIGVKFELVLAVFLFRYKSLSNISLNFRAILYQKTASI